MFIISSMVLCLLGFLFIPANEPRLIVLLFGLAIGFLTAFISVISSVFNHLSDLQTFRESNVRILAANDRLKVLRLSLNDILGDGKLKEDILQRANKDAPVSTIINNVDSALRNIESETLRGEVAQQSISIRAKGPFGFIVKIYGSQ